MADPHHLIVAGLPLWVYGWADAAGTSRYALADAAVRDPLTGLARRLP